MSETLGIIYTEANFLSISGPVKLENKLSVPKIQWWDRRRIREKMERKKMSFVPSNFEI